jgi:CheY-like chemotaxis protein
MIRTIPLPLAGDKRKRVLTVDDDRGITKVVKGTLERSGLFVVMEENLSELALHTAKIFRPDLVLLDWHMPVIDGAGVVAQLVADPLFFKVEVIFLTSFSDRASKLGYDFIEKPFTGQLLLETVRTKFPELEVLPLELRI